jgi:glutaminase
MPERNRKTDPDRIREVVDAIVPEIGGCDDWGKTSDFIPELSNVDPKQFGLAVSTCDGDEIEGGDAAKPFLIQSISKVFALTLALEAFGENVWKRVGREPSGDPYNSIRDLEQHKGVPRNPFINSGALVVVDMLLEQHARGGKVGEQPDFVRERLAALADCGSHPVDEKAVNSEESSSYTNRALANLAKSFDNLHHEVRDVHYAYSRQCAVAMNCRQLAKAGRYLMFDRADDVTGIDKDAAFRSRRTLSLMLTCGQYDGAGEFAYRVGLPAKSGVSGAILAIVPNVASIAVWSPGLDENGNSLLGTLALERLAERMDWSVFGSVERHG